MAAAYAAGVAAFCAFLFLPVLWQGRQLAAPFEVPRCLTQPAAAAPSWLA
jgi:hypothetical protein